MMQKKSLAAAISLLMAGCTSLAPVYHRPLPKVEGAYPDTGVYADQGTSKTSRVSAAEIAWNDFFQDPRLQDLIKIALINNQDLRVAVLNVEAAQAQYRISRADLMPKLSGVGTGGRSYTPGYQLTPGTPNLSNTFNVGLGASWELDLFGRVQSLKDIALQKYFATIQAQKAAKIALVAQVADQYLTVLAYNELLKITEQTLESARESLQFTKLQYDTGTVSELDYMQAQTAVESALANQQQQARMHAQAVNALVLLIGEPIPKDLPEGDSINSQNLLTDIPAGLPSDLLTRRPDVISAEDNLKAANANIGVARAAFFPSITLTGNYGSITPDFSSLFEPGFGAWSFLPKITLPIFSGGANIANLKLAKTQEKIAVAQYQKAIQQAFREVADGLVARNTFDLQVKAQQRDVKAQKKRLNLSTLRYKNGIDSYLNVLTAQTALYASEQSLVQAQLGRLSNLVDLYRALGGGWLQSGESKNHQTIPAKQKTKTSSSVPRSQNKQTVSDGDNKRLKFRTNENDIPPPLTPNPSSRGN